MTEKIFTGLDRAQELGFISYRLLMEKLASVLNHKPDWNAVDSTRPLTAFVSHGRWGVTCECGESFYAEPTDPLAYCPTCGNILIDGKVRPVAFPANRLVIEQALLERKMAGDPGTIRKLGTQVHMFGKLAYPEVLPRHWDGQTVEELRAEHRKVREIMDEMKKQRGEGQ